MRKLLLPLLLLLLVFSANAQPTQKIYYYYKGQKVFYPVSFDRIAVGIKPGNSFGNLKKTIASLLAVSEDSLQGTLSGKQLLVKLGRNKVKDITPYISKLKQNGAITFARPAFVSGSGNYNSYGAEFIVDLKSSTNFTSVQNLMKKTGCTLVRRYPFEKDMYILAAGIQANYDGLAMANQFYETGLFDYAEPDIIAYDAFHVAPNDPLYFLQWAHENTGSAAQYNGTPGADLKVQQAWNITMGSAAIKIGVIDDGVDLTHPDLQANLLQGFNGITMTSNPGDGGFIDPASAHGTNCAGIIGAVANNGIGMAGIAPNCKIIPAMCDVGGGLSTAAAAASFDYLRINGADVISNSYGSNNVSSVLDAAIHRAVTLGRAGKGCIVLFSSGNDNGALLVRASNPEVIAVGGISMCNQRKSPTSCDGELWGANYGTGLDVVAPCVKIVGTDNQGTGGYNTAGGTAGDYYNIFNGTSSSCPIAAGVVALMLSVNPSLTEAQARQVLEASCDKIPGYSFAADAAQPNGTWNNELGHGRVNAFTAVQLAAAGVTSVSYINSGTVTAVEAAGNANGTIEPGEKATMTVQLINASPGITATNVTAILTSSTAGVTIIQNTANYGDIAALGNAINTATPYLFDVSSSVSCGTVINFTLTVTYGGGLSPQVFNFSVTAGAAITVSITATVGSAPPTGAEYISSSGSQSGRLNRNNVVPSCGVPKALPPLQTATGARAYQAYTFTSASTGCVTIDIASAGLTNIYEVVYGNGGFVPTNTQTNYLADEGLVSNTALFSFTATAGQQYTIVVHEVNPGGAVGTNYTLNVRFPSCAIVPPPPSASLLTVKGSSDICNGTSTNLAVAITGGTSPYSVIYNDGTQNYTVNNYTSGTDIPVSPIVTTTYSLVSVTDVGFNEGTGNSGTPTVTVKQPVTWYLDVDGDTHYVSTLSACDSPGPDYNTTGGTLGDCADNNNAVWQSGLLYVDGDSDGYDAGQATVCYGATIPTGYSLTTNGTDCDDTNPSAQTVQTWYLDADGDTHYVSSVSSCGTPGTGYNTTGGTMGDCDDNDNTKWQSALLYVDVDGDGYDAGQSTVCYGAIVPTGFSLTSGGTDCNDANANIKPGAAEICGNGIDDNCNGSIDENCNTCQNAISFSTSSISTTSAQLNWVASVDPVQWQVQYKTTKQGSKWIDVVVGGDKRSVTISPLLVNQNYNWHIRAKCGKNWTPYSAAIMFKTLASVPLVSSRQAATTIDEGKAIQLYPNPARGKFKLLVRLTKSINANAKIELFSTSGQAVYTLLGFVSNGVLQTTIQVPMTVASGMYVVKVTTANEVQQAKLVYSKN